MQIKKKIIIHIGYPKTGTTFLQNKIFNMDKFNYFILKKFDYIFDSILYDSDQNFKSKKKKISDIFKKFILKNKINIISREGFLGLNTNIKRNFARLKELLNKDVKIIFIMVVRKQINILESFYAEDFINISKKQKEYKFYKNFIFNFCKLNISKNDQTYIIRENLKYYKIYQKIKKIFPLSKIIIFDYDDLFHNKKLEEKFNKFIFKKKIIKNLNLKFENKGLKTKNERYRNYNSLIIFLKKPKIYDLFFKNLIPRTIKNYFRILLNKLSNYDKIYTDNKKKKFIKSLYKKENLKISKLKK